MRFGDEMTLIIPSNTGLLVNMRNHSPQQITPRPGMSPVSTYGPNTYGVGTHSLKRMNSGSSFIRLVGVGPNLVELVSNTLVDKKFSGNPLSMVAFRPEQSPLPWMYVADIDQMRKISMALVDYMMGVATPLNPPTTAPSNETQFGPQSLQVIYDFSLGTMNADWVPGGTAGAQGPAQIIDTILAVRPDTPSLGAEFFPDFASIEQNGTASLLPTNSTANINVF